MVLARKLVALLEMLAAELQYLFQSFAGTHNHYMVSNSAAVDGQDLDDLIGNLTEHGYADVPEAQLLLFVNPAPMRDVARVRTTDPVGPAYDFIPSLGAPPWIADEVILNPAAQAPATLPGHKDRGQLTARPGSPSPGSCRRATCCSWQPAGRAPRSTRSASAAHHPGLPGAAPAAGQPQRVPAGGLVLQPRVRGGRTHRGAAAVMQIKPSGAYTPPTL